MRRRVINPNQKVLLDTFADGDYRATFTEITDVKQRDHEAKLAGDNLFTFLMFELSDQEGCRDYETALVRLNQAQAELEAVRQAIAAARMRPLDEA